MAKRVLNINQTGYFPGTLVLLLLVVASIISAPAMAGPFAAPGDIRLRHDLQLLNDSGVTRIPLNTWPVSIADIVDALDRAELDALSLQGIEAYQRVRDRIRSEMGTGEISYLLSLGASRKPQKVRSFDDVPREEGEIGAGIRWTGNRFAFDLRVTGALDANDNDDLRPDESYIGAVFGNWMISAGLQERWWGPGRDGSLILSSNARPIPALALQRNTSEAFKSRWLSWAGPWTLSTFMGQLNDERTIDDALLFGMRVTFRPSNNLEIGLSRTAQWCGDERPCSASTFVDLLLGRDNRGVNVDIEDEPGNQLAGFDLRWTLPNNLPVALYVQWIGEDTRAGGPAIGSWMRQAGVEHWGRLGSLQHRTHVEFSETSCRDGGLGFSNIQVNCGYEHTIYRTGYRFTGRSLGHGMDGDGLSYSLGSTLVQSAGHIWNFTFRYMDINRIGSPSSRHTLSATPQNLADIHLAHDRLTHVGRFRFGLGLSHLDDKASDRTSTDVTGFIEWTTE